MRVFDSNESPEMRRLKALVYGKSGTGKSSFGVSAPNPLILLSEQQGIPHIRAAAIRLGRATPATVTAWISKHVLVMECLDDYRMIIKALHGDRSKPFVVINDAGDTVFTSEQWPDSVVLDSVTDVCEMISLEIREQSPPKVGKDGLPVDSERYWNVLLDRAQKLIRAFRDVDANVLFLCLQDDRTTGEGDDAVRWVGPQLPMRKLPGALMAAVNVVGITYRQIKAKVAEYGIRTIGPDYVDVKPFPPLLPLEVTDFTSWCLKINGEDDGQRAPVPVDDSQQIEAPKEPKSEPAIATDAKPAAEPAMSTALKDAMVLDAVGDSIELAKPEPTTKRKAKAETKSESTTQTDGV